MKNIILIISLFCFTVPVFAVCSITGGACSANYTPNWESPPLDEKYDPDYLEDLEDDFDDYFEDDDEFVDEDDPMDDFEKDDEKE